MTREIRRIDLAGPRTHLDEMTSVFLYYGVVQSITRVRLPLTNAYYRHNNTYLRLAGRSYGPTQKAPSKTAGTQTHRYPPPSPRRGLRHFVPPQSLLRPQRPAASALRDATTPPGGWRFYRRCLCDLRRLSPHLLSGTNRIPTQWPECDVCRPAEGELERGKCARLGSSDGDGHRLCPDHPGSARTPCAGGPKGIPHGISDRRRLGRRAGDLPGLHRPPSRRSSDRGRCASRPASALGAEECHLRPDLRSPGVRGLAERPGVWDSRDCGRDPGSDGGAGARPHSARPLLCDCARK